MLTVGEMLQLTWLQLQKQSVHVQERTETWKRGGKTQSNVDKRVKRAENNVDKHEKEAENVVQT